MVTGSLPTPTPTPTPSTANTFYGDGAGTNPDGGVGGLSAPTVSPTALSSGVCTNKSITATFSEAMNPSTINSTSFKVGAGASATPVTGTVTYDSVKKAATFTPSSDFAASTAFTATITTGAKSQAGTSLANDVVWSFATSLCKKSTSFFKTSLRKLV